MYLCIILNDIILKVHGSFNLNIIMQFNKRFLCITKYRFKQKFYRNLIKILLSDIIMLICHYININIIIILKIILYFKRKMNNVIDKFDKF